jgi:hypothetical protein
VTSSLTARCGLPGTIGYTASKAAVMSLMNACMPIYAKTCERAGGQSGCQTQLTKKEHFNIPFHHGPKKLAIIFELHE